MPSTIVTAAETQLRAARQELERSLRAGTDARAENLFPSFPALAADAEASLELVYTEFVVRSELGQNPKPADWVERFPQLKIDLEQVFEVDRELRKEEGSRTQPNVRRIDRSPWSVPGYEVLEELGRGGMGVVYKARQTGLNRIVALKVILSGLHAGERDRTRFRREAEAAARLDHPHIVRIYEVGESDGRPYCAMEFVEGGTLAVELTGTPWPFRRAAEFVAVTADAVHHAHERGIVHRDLKPANILAPSDPKIADFGLAKFLTESEAAAGPTRSGDLVGTPAYMAPEQALARTASIGPATDIWALGVTLYELLTGRLPFQGESSSETLDQVRTQQPVPLQRLRPNLPFDLQTICLKCLAKAPAARYVSAADLAADLNRWLGGEPILARPVSNWERARGWCRRNPRVAGLAASVALLLASTLIFGVLALVNLADNNAQSKKLAEQEHAARQKAEEDSHAQAALLLEGQRRMTQLRVADGLRKLDDGDFAGGAVILAAAFENDPDPANESLHRLRLGVTLRALPSLTRFQLTDGKPDPGGCLSGDGAYVAFVDADSHRRIRATLVDGHRSKFVTPAAQIAFERLNQDGRVLARIFMNQRSAAVDLETGEKVPLPLPLGVGALPPPFMPNGSHQVLTFQNGTLLTGDFNGSYSFNKIHVVTPNGRRVGPPIVAPVDTVDFRAAELSRDGTLVLTGDQKGVIRQWDTATGKPVGHEFKLDGSIQCVRFFSNGARIVSGSSNGFAHVWNRESGETVGRLIVHGGTLHEVLISDCQRRLLTWSMRDRNARLWNVATGLPLGEQIRFPSAMRRVQLHPNGAELLAIGLDGTLRTWDLFAGDPISSPLYGATVAQYASEGRALVAASAGGALRAWSLNPTQPLSFIPYMAETFWIDNESIASISRGKITVWEAGTGKVVREELVDNLTVYNTEALADGRLLLFRHEKDRNHIQIWNPKTNRFDHPPVPVDSGLRGNSVLADGRFVAWEPDGVLRFRDLATGAEVGTPLGHREAAWIFNVTPDARRLLTHGSMPRLWDLENYKLIAEFRDINPARKSKLTPDGRSVAAITRDRQFVLYDVEIGSLRGGGWPLGDWISKLTLAPDGRTCATVNDVDRSVQVWEMATGRRLGLPLHHRTEVSVLVFSPDSRFLATGTKTGVVQVWDAARGVPVTPPLGRGRDVTRLKFRPDGRQLLASNFDGRTWLWDLTPDSRPAAELAAFARMLANRKLDDRGVLVPLTPDEEHAHWRQFWK